MKRFFLTICLILAPLCIFAEEDVFKHLIDNYQELGGTSEVLDRTENYMHVSLSDSAYIEMFFADNVIVVYTVCAPICSSCARVYNNEFEFLFPLTPPFVSVFPLATIDKETGRIIWTDNDKWEY